MNSIAMILMIVTMVLVTAITGFLFWKVLVIPPKPEPDSYSENDEPEK